MSRETIPPVPTPIGRAFSSDLATKIIAELERDGVSWGQLRGTAAAKRRRAEERRHWMRLLQGECTHPWGAVIERGFPG